MHGVMTVLTCYTVLYFRRLPRHCHRHACISRVARPGVEDDGSGPERGALSDVSLSTLTEPSGRSGSLVVGFRI